MVLLALMFIVIIALAVIAFLKIYWRWAQRAAYENVVAALRRTLSELEEKQSTKNGGN